MLDLRGWLRAVVLPLLLVVLVDQGTKAWALRLTTEHAVGPLRLLLLKNPGFLLGSLSQASEVYTVVLPATLGMLLLFAFAVLQDFLPIESRWLRTGASVFVGGVVSNLVDRVLRGEVTDFLELRAFGTATGVFNVADALQWAGLVVLFASYVANGRLLYPVAQRRGQRWIDPAFQTRYCAVLLGTGAGFALIGGVLSYTFIRYALSELGHAEPAVAARFVRNFLQLYLYVAAAFFVLLTVIGVHMSHRIIGPIKGFENFLLGLLRGETRQFRMRRTDDLRQLEAMADNFYRLFHERLGLDPPALAEGSAAPYFEAETWDRQKIELRDLLGKKVWMIFYRYATCPLCAVHLEGIKDTVRRVQDAGVTVIAVYESSPDEFKESGHEVTLALLHSMGIPMIADPSRRLYRAYGTRQRIRAVVRWSVLRTLLEARRRKFSQGKLHGKLGQQPAHFLIDENGIIARAFYGDSAISHIELADVRTFAGV
jgi:signal peptidase II